MSKVASGVRIAVVWSIVAVTGASGAWAQGAWTAPPEAKNLKNGVTGPGNARKAAEANCVACHGPAGKGDGPQAAALPAKPADWTSEAIQKQTDGELFWKISNGRGPMPPWKHLPEKERWELVHYIRSLKK